MTRLKKAGIGLAILIVALSAYLSTPHGRLMLAFLFYMTFGLSVDSMNMRDLL